MMHLDAEIMDAGYTWHTDPPDVWGSCPVHRSADLVVVLGLVRDQSTWLLNEPMCVECGRWPWTIGYLSDG